jgi:hypothetical protein
VAKATFITLTMLAVLKNAAWWKAPGFRLFNSIKKAVIEFLQIVPK